MINFRRLGRFLFPRFLGTLLMVVLGLPVVSVPVVSGTRRVPDTVFLFHALRPEMDRAGLEEALAPRAGLEEREEKLARLKEWVKAKQEELDALFRSMPPDSGEYLDLERAVARIGRITEFAEYLLKGGHSESFGPYLKNVARPLLQMDVEDLNKFLPFGGGSHYQLF